ncbi:uncharacterized protein [Panulirus ornatus]|uniref:uncharacterized protein n=1 Tax=Panulirus ornatus TaxID=150431 RepID=UPI003A8C4735
MKTLVLLLVPCLAFAAVGRDGSHGGPSPPQGQPPPGSTYEAPPLSPQQPSFEPTQYEFQAPHPQFNYQPNYIDPVWGVGPALHEESFLGSWVDKGLKVLTDVVPVALSVIIVITILTFLGLVNIPVLSDFSETQVHLGRALANLDVDQLANTVILAIDKYNELFGQ